jgi:hypothetical protein
MANTAAVKVAGKPFPVFGLCGRASGQQFHADLVKRIQDSSARDSTLLIIFARSFLRTAPATVHM